MNSFNMKRFFDDIIASPRKKALPVLSFPSTSLLGVNVRALIGSSELQAKGMKAVADRVPSAASVSMMDLSVEAEAFGSPVAVSDDEIPTVRDAIVFDEDDARAIEIPEVGAARTGRYIEAIGKAKALICDRPVLAGVIGPFSLAARLAGVSDAMVLAMTEPETMHVLLRKTTDFLTGYITAYRDIGADGAVMAEPVAGLLSPSLDAEFSAPYIKRITDAVQRDDFAIIYHNCGGSVIKCAESIISTGAAAFHFGNAVDMRTMLELMPKDKVVMGNIDPSSQFRGGTPSSIRESTLKLLEDCSVYPNFVISSGCDIPPGAPWENIDAFFAAVGEFYG